MQKQREVILKFDNRFLQKTFAFPKFRLCQHAAPPIPADKKKHPPRQLIFIVERGFAIPAVFTELAGNASSDPVNLHDVHLAAAGADAFQLRFPENLDLRPFVKTVAGILQRPICLLVENARSWGCHYWASSNDANSLICSNRLSLFDKRL